MEKHEWIFGEDLSKNTQKIYITSQGNKIYGIEKIKNRYLTRYYVPDEKFNKTRLDNFIGKEGSDLFYELFRFDTMNRAVYEKYTQTYNFTLNSFHFNFNELIIKKYKNKIKTLLKYFNCNIKNIDNWLNTHRNHYINWIAITKNKQEVEIALYYRKYKFNELR